MFCGYDPEMSEGLKKFGKGVATSTLKKAASAGRTLRKQVDVELTQLGVLVDELGRVEKTSTSKSARNHAKALRGLAEVCRAAFLGAEGLDDVVAFQLYFADQFIHFGELVRKLEDAFEASAPEMDLSKKTGTAVESAIAAS
ncbi:MAG: hypothetical protein UW83_C0014G0010 [Parcubacteria group bacterium GW2011_GWD1_44_9]|nr:MAG: hypothetical protein UW83_C0014G0010 [Parcubacteria group bacterium GW2011_GWD1_44_9]